MIHIHRPVHTRTGAHVAWFLIVEGQPAAAFQAWVTTPRFEGLIAHLDAPPCMPSGGMLDCAGPTVGLARWFYR